MRRPASLFRRLLVTYLLLSLGTLAVLGVALDRVLEHRATANLERQLAAEARAVEAAVNRSPAASWQSLIRAMGVASGTRLTVIRRDGVVLADSEHDPATMENHAGRPEVRQALAGRIGKDIRTSATLGKPFLYLTLPATTDLIVRTALPANEVSGQRSAARGLVLAAILTMTALAAVASVLVARSLSRPLADIGDRVAAVAEGRFSSLEPAGPRETRTLTEAVNRMASELAARVDDLRRETGLREEILSAMQDGVLLSTPDGAAIYANPAAVELLGPDAGHTVARWLPGQGETEVTVRHPSRRDLHVAAVRLADERRLVVVRDVTETRRLEAMRRDFVADASHELKTPVSAILATAETIQDAVEHDPPRVPGFTATLVTEARRLGRLVEDLLSLARLERGEEPFEPVPLSEVARAAVDLVRPAAASKGLAVEDTIEPGVTVAGSRRDLSLAIRNLLDNSIRYTTEGTVGLTLSAANGHALIRVADSGVGIPSKDLPRVFERFYRVDEARARETGGTGLGLAIVKHVAERHGGTVEASSELGRGSIFTLSIPIHPSRHSP